MTQSNPFSVTCQLCEVADDVRKMSKYQGQFYHKIKTQRNRVSCLQAMKDFARGK